MSMVKFRARRQVALSVVAQNLGKTDIEIIGMQAEEIQYLRQGIAAADALLKLKLSNSLPEDQPAALMVSVEYLDKLEAEFKVQRQIDRAYADAIVALNATLTTIKNIAANLDIPQTHSRAVEQLQGMDSLLDKQWNTVRGFMLGADNEIPSSIPAVIYARKEAVASFLQSPSKKWQPLYDHVLKTAAFGLEELPTVSEYDSGGKVNGRLWLAERWAEVAKDQPHLGAGGIWRQIKGELEDEKLPEDDSGLPREIKAKIVALKSLNHYRYERAGDLAVELRRVGKRNRKITHV